MVATFSDAMKSVAREKRRQLYQPKCVHGHKLGSPLIIMLGALRHRRREPELKAGGGSFHGIEEVIERHGDASTPPHAAALVC